MGDDPAVPWFRTVADRLVVLPRLLERLDGPEQVVLVQAPAGFGKSTLLRLWSQTRPNEGVRVVDDLDHLDEVEVARLLAEVRRTPGARLVAAARGPVAVSGPDVGVVAGRDLRFTVDEAVDLWAGLGLARRQDRPQALRDAVGGWPRLMRALGEAVAGSELADEDVAARVAREHLAGTVAALDDEARATLAALVAPSRLTPDLVTLLIAAPDPAPVLAGLLEQGLVDTEVVDGETGHRWPSAVRTALRDLLAGPGDRERHGLLGRWHLDRAEAERALEHALAAEDEALAGEVLDRHWLALNTYTQGALVDFFRRVPEEWLARSRLLEGVRSLVLLPPGDTQGWERLVPDAEELSRWAASEDPRGALNLGLVQVFGLRRARRTEEALAAVNRLSDAARVARRTHHGEVADLLAPVFLLTALVHELSGDAVGAIEPLRAAVEAAPTSTNRGSARHASAHLAMNLALLGEVEEAEEWLDAVEQTPAVSGWVVPRARIAGWVGDVLVATSVLDHARARTALRGLLAVRDPLDELWPWVLYARAQYALLWGDRHAALQQVLVERAARPGLATPGSQLDALTRAAEVDLLLALGQSERAAAALERAGAAQPLLDAPRARVSLLAGRPAETLALARDALTSRPVVRRVREELVLLEAVARHRLGEPDADAALRRVLAEHPGPSRRALALTPRADLVALAGPALLEGVPTVFPVEPEPVRLTRREQVVLSHLATGLSREEVAALLSVSVHTVKSQAHAAYRKLGVRSRQDAVRAARRHGLLDEAAG